MFYSFAQKYLIVHVKSTGKLIRQFSGLKNANQYIRLYY